MLSISYALDLFFLFEMALILSKSQETGISIKKLNLLESI